MSLPSSRIPPSVGCSNPAIIRSVVVLPQPDGPSIEKNSPPGICEVDAVDGRHVAELLDEINQFDFATGHAPPQMSFEGARYQVQLAPHTSNAAMSPTAACPAPRSPRVKKR